MALVRNSRFLFVPQATNIFFFRLCIRSNGLPFQHLQLGLDPAFLFSVSGISFRRFRLTFQMMQLSSQLLSQIAQPIKIIPGVSDTSFSFPAPFLIFRNSGGFLNVYPDVFRLGFN